MDGVGEEEAEVVGVAGIGVMNGLDAPVAGTLPHPESASNNRKVKANVLCDPVDSRIRICSVKDLEGREEGPCDL